MLSVFSSVLNKLCYTFGVIKLIAQFCIVLALGFSSGYSLACPFSRIVVFGDSLSDIGNYPENPNWQVANPLPNPKDPDNYNSMFYVPVSNPLNTGNLRLVPMKLFLHKIAKYQTPQPLIDSQNRAYNSANWVEFFLEKAFETNHRRIIIPSYYIENHKNLKVKQSDSIDYAWSSALSGDACYSDDWNTKYKNCDVTDSLNRFYEQIDNKNPNTYNNYDSALQQLQIPGLLFQIEQFKQDYKRLDINNDNTLYIIWIGGNDLAYYFNNLENGDILGGLKGLAYQIAYNNYLAIEALVASGARHIYVFNMFNVSMTPRISHTNVVERTAGKLFVNIYNSGLKFAVYRIKKEYPNVDVHIFDTHKVFSAMKKTGFVPDIACETTSKNYVTANPPADNCAQYIFWNAIHPTTVTNKNLADALMGFVKKTWQSNDIGAAQTVKAEKKISKKNFFIALDRGL